MELIMDKLIKIKLEMVMESFYSIIQKYFFVMD